MDEQLQLAGRDALALVEVLDVIEGVIGGDVRTPTVPAVGQEDDELAARNLFGEADRIAGSASMPGTRRQYAAI